MKKLFVITTINQKENQESPDILTQKFKSEKEKSIFDLDLVQTHAESTNLSQSPKTDSWGYSRKYSLNALSTENSISANLNIILEGEKKNDEKKDFLGKKCKSLFNIIKNCSHNNNLENELNIEKKDNKELLKLKRLKLRIKSKKIFDHDKMKNINEGRWTLEERIKFIEAYIENGKKWKKVQEYVGSRTCSQTRSHAQKFLLKLKSISNAEFDFTKDSIKSLDDILEEIKNKKGIKNICNANDKKYIIDILLNLSECSNDTCNNEINNTLININNICSESNNIIVNLNKKEKENTSIKEEKSSNIENNDGVKEKEIRFNISNNILTKEIENKNIIQEKKGKLSEKNNNIKSKESLKNGDDKYNINYNNFFEPVEQKLLFDGGFAFYINNNSIYNINNISFYMMEYNFNRNIERSKFINRNFFT